MFGKPKGLCEISQVHGKFVLVCLGLRKGQVRVEHYASRPRYVCLTYESLSLAGLFCKTFIYYVSLNV
ncbi:hypothetical protein Hanom_Chr15g01400901 [Helianthus anomalus]